MVGRFDGERLSLDEAHRFDSRPVRLPDGLHTDVLRIFAEIQHGLARGGGAGRRGRRASASTPGASTSPSSTATALLLGNPYHYRDAIGGSVMEAAFARVPRAEIFAATGIQLLEINTLFQLLRLQERGSAALERGAAPADDAGPLLLLALRAGRRTSTRSPPRRSASTWPRGRWATALLERLSLPDRDLRRDRARRAPCSATCCPTSRRRRACRRGR